MRQRGSVRRALLLAAAVLVATGCGSDSGGGTAGRDEDDPVARESRPAPKPSGGLGLPTSPPSSPTDVGTKLRLVGQVVAAGEDHVVLRDGNGMKWALTGDLATGLAPAGAPVQVTGRARIDQTRDGLPVVRVDRVDDQPQRS